MNKQSYLQQRERERERDQRQTKLHAHVHTHTHTHTRIQRRESLSAAHASCQHATAPWCLLEWREEIARAVINATEHLCTPARPATRPKRRLDWSKQFWGRMVCPGAQTEVGEVIHINGWLVRAVGDLHIVAAAAGSNSVNRILDCVCHSRQHSARCIHNCHVRLCNVQRKARRPDHCHVRSPSTSRPGAWGSGVVRSWP